MPAESINKQKDIFNQYHQCFQNKKTLSLRCLKNTDFSHKIYRKIFAFGKKKEK